MKRILGFMIVTLLFTGCFKKVDNNVTKNTDESNISVEEEQEIEERQPREFTEEEKQRMQEQSNHIASVVGKTVASDTIVYLHTGYEEPAYYVLHFENGELSETIIYLSFLSTEEYSNQVSYHKEMENEPIVYTNDEFQVVAYKISNIISGSYQ